MSGYQPDAYWTPREPAAPKFKKMMEIGSKSIHSWDKISLDDLPAGTTHVGVEAKCDGYDGTCEIEVNFYREEDISNKERANEEKRYAREMKEYQKRLAAHLELKKARGEKEEAKRIANERKLYQKLKAKYEKPTQPKTVKFTKEDDLVN